ncbi:protein kinase family protein [Microbacterium halophytorum]|uniref:aminoglycoside phosphotransferase n=1 Tax=Microbacterium halophytorum TaxID=2067568 RepID=UPI000CFB421B|nr:aminoglycoside phosphotransferase [Microbacterium halophytorum]
MARSPLTLAAAVTAAVPGAEIDGTRRLTAGGDERYDSAVATLADGREAVIRVPSDDEADQELAAQVVALHALTAGVRRMLPVDAPEFLGQTGLDGSRAVVTTMLPGYQIDAAAIPPGDGAARSLGRTLAAIHALPASVVRAAGLRERTAAEVRSDAGRVLDRAAASGHVPVRLTVRWREAVDDDRLWSFEPAVVLGGVGAAAFLYGDDERGAPTVTGVYDWHGLAIDDPAVDLKWLSTAPEAEEHVLAAYADASHRAPDPAFAARSRLHAEMEFARWLLHGADAHRDDIVRDAAALLDALAQDVRDYGLLDDLPRNGSGGVDDAIALLGRFPGRAEQQHPATSMETDAYAPEDLAFAGGWHADGAREEDAAPERTAADEEEHRVAQSENETQPVELGEFERDVLADGADASDR